MRCCAAWLQHFAEMDRLYEAACEVESAIEDSIGAEQYAEATRLRGAYAEIQERDDVNTVLKVSARPEHSFPPVTLIGCGLILSRTFRLNLVR